MTVYFIAYIKWDPLQQVDDNGVVPNESTVLPHGQTTLPHRDRKLWVSNLAKAIFIFETKVKTIIYVLQYIGLKIRHRLAVCLLSVFIKVVSVAIII